MSFRVKQLGLVAACIGLFCALYWGTKISPIGKTKTEAKEEVSQSAEIINWDNLTKDALSSLNNEDSILYINLLKKSDTINDLNKKVTVLRSMATFWIEREKHTMAANTLEKIAAIVNTDSMWVQASTAYQAASNQVAANSVVLFQNKAIACMKRAVEISPNKTTLKIQLANAIIDEGSAPMEGIGLLLDLVKQDSTNIEAQNELARLAIMSGQYEKALSRLQSIMKMKPDDADALFLLGEAYKGTGNKEEAIAAFEKCKSKVKGDSLKAALDMYINQLQNN